MNERKKKKKKEVLWFLKEEMLSEGRRANSSLLFHFRFAQQEEGLTHSSPPVAMSLFHDTQQQFDRGLCVFGSIFRQSFFFFFLNTAVNCRLMRSISATRLFVLTRDCFFVWSVFSFKASVSVKTLAGSSRRFNGLPK